MRFALALLLACTFARANSLTDLKTTLSAVQAAEPIKATVTFESSRQTGDDKSAVPGKVNALVEDGPDGLQIRWPRAIIETVVAEETARTKDRNRPAPTRGAMDGLNANTLNDYLNGATPMLRELGAAELVGEKAESWQGQPAKLLSLKITPPLSEKDKKYIKEIEVTAKVWIGADGWPLAAEHAMHLKGRALLVITFEQSERQEFRYAHTGGRLVTVYHLKEGQNSGAGESGQTRSVATLTPEKV